MVFIFGQPVPIGGTVPVHFGIGTENDWLVQGLKTKRYCIWFSIPAAVPIKFKEKMDDYSLRVHILLKNIELKINQIKEHHGVFEKWKIKKNKYFITTTLKLKRPENPGRRVN